MATFFTEGQFLVGPAQRAETLVAEGERIVAMGGPELALQAGARDRVVSLGGRVVSAGLWDSHIHWTGMAAKRLQLDLVEVASLDEMLERVKTRCQATPTDDFVVGSGWNQNRWGGRLPHRRDLDRVAPHHAVVLWARDHHGLVANSEALRRLQYDAATADPPGGHFDRDPEGLTGIVQEKAAGALFERVPAPPAASVVEEVRAAAAEMIRMGLVGATCMEPEGGLGLLARLAPEEVFRANVFLVDAPGEPVVPFAIPAGFGGAWLRFLGLKLFMDGALGTRTAWMAEAYDDADTRGITRTSGEELRVRSAAAARVGWAMAVHAIGDQAVAEAISGLSTTIDPTNPVTSRIEHAQLVHPKDQMRLPASGLAASMQAIHIWEDRPAMRSGWGSRSAYAFPLRTLWDKGVPVLLGSDAPIERADPIQGMMAAVWRSRREEPPFYADEALTPWQALASYTEVPARMDARPSGQLEVGRLADFTIYDRDPLEALARREPFAVVGTALGGQLRYQAF